MTGRPGATAAMTLCGFSAHSQNEMPRPPPPGTEHVTIAVSATYAGHTVDFRRLAARGITLLGRVEGYRDGALAIAPSLALALPEDQEARRMEPGPASVTDLILSLDLRKECIASIVCATGYALDFGWIKMDVFDEKGRPRHQRGLSDVAGLSVLGLPSLTRCASPFIWSVLHDADDLAGYIAVASA